ncbi:hypothetical protein FQR65_LT08063 [Abscondita terminalis]|nr:hypothetical protein FQR65_LT08063 [Abscondita terminalis]
MDQEEDDNKKRNQNAEGDGKSITSQVLEYYQRYSQNRELPKYFCGASAINQQNWSFVPESTKIPIKICTESVQQASQEELPKITVENVCATSPSSSVASNRKLEWDSGADIGYIHSNIHKSISLPTLINELTLDKLRAKFQTSCTKKDTNDVSVEANVKYSDLSSSESPTSSRKGYILSTPSSSSNQELTDSGTGRKQLKSSVGLPIAQSTPIVDGYGFTPPSDNAKSQIDLNMVDRVSQYKNMKVLKLSVSKTIAVECAGATEPLHGKSKLVQTSPQSNPSIAVQTDFDCTDCHIIRPSVKSSEKQNVFYVCFTDSDKDTTSATPCSTMQTQTNSNELSNCDSFEYLDGGNIENKLKGEIFLPQETKQLDDENPISVLAQKQPESSEKEQSNYGTSEYPNGGHAFAQKNTLLKQKLAGNNIKELKRNIELLQKLINSQKYDSVTKKYYVKKIIQRILDNKNSSTKTQSEVSNSIKSQTDKPVSSISDFKSDEETPRNISSEFSSEKQSNENTSDKNKLFKTSTAPEANSQSFQVKKTRKSQLNTQYFSNDFVPKEETIATNGRLKRSALLTLTDNRDSAVREQSPDKSDAISISQTKQSQGSSSSFKESEVGGKHRNWRDSKTNSEINLEQKIGDCNYPIINFAKKERDNQLYWINNEIVHLSKLKKVLECDKDASSKLDKITKEIRVEDLKGVKKQTTVYVLSTERDSSPFRSSQSSRSRGCGCKAPSFTTNAMVEIGEDKINLQDAHLVQSEVFTSNSDDAKRTTTVRRYVFELPLEQNNVATQRTQPESQMRRSSTPGRSGRSYSKRNNYDSVDGNEEHYDSSTKNESPPGMGSRPDQRRGYYNSEMKNEFPPGIVLNQIKGGSRDDRRGSYQDPEFSGEVEDRNYNKNGRVCCKCQESDSSCDCKPKSACCKCCPCASTRSKNPIIVQEDPVRYPNKPTCFKNHENNLTKQLVLTDEISSERVLQDNPLCVEQSVQSGRSHTLSRNLVMSEDICLPKPDAFTKPKNVCSCVIEERSSELVCACEPKLCICCKEQKTAKPSGPCPVCPINNEEKEDGSLYLLCYPCYEFHGNEAKPNLVKSHVCKCRFTETMKKINKTVQQLENLESETELCECKVSDESVRSPEDENVCPKCKRLLKPRYRRRKGGLAYSITLEPDDKLPVEQKQELMESLQEIKIKIPSPRNSKNVGCSSSLDSPSSSTDKSVCCCKPKKCSRCGCKMKNGEINSKKVSSEENIDEIIIQVPKIPKNRAPERKKKNFRQRRDNNFVVCRCASEAKSSSENSSAQGSNYTSEVSDAYQLPKHRYTLQDYLRKNNPSFVSSADKRRQLLTGHSNKREGSKEKHKDAAARAYQSKYRKSQAIFSTKEMKQITAKNYKKSKEFQQKLMDIREREIKRSNKLFFYNCLVLEIVIETKLLNWCC